jgi:hypothetical protein
MTNGVPKYRDGRTYVLLCNTDSLALLRKTKRPTKLQYKSTQGFSKARES